MGSGRLLKGWDVICHRCGTRMLRLLKACIQKHIKDFRGDTKKELRVVQRDDTEDWDWMISKQIGG